MRVQFLRLICLIIGLAIVGSCSDDEQIELDPELVLAQQLADHLRKKGFKVELSDSRVNIHRESIESAKELAQASYDFLTAKDFKVDKIDLEASIQYGLGNDYSYGRTAEKHCERTDLEEGPEGMCQFAYCWDDENEDYYYMEAVCSTDDGIIREEIE